jgi:thiol-disulfide isomerase/thioredoxin
MREAARKAVRDVYRSPIVGAAVAFAVVAIGASWLVGGFTPPHVDGGRLTFSGVDLEGRPVSLADPRFAGKVVFVDIWGAWCSPCLASIPMFSDLQRRYGPQGFEVIGVEFASSYSGTREEYIEGLRAWVKERGVNYTIVHGGETREVDAFFPNLKSFQSFPTTILIGRDGRVRAVERGYYAGMASQYETMIGELLREPVPMEGKSDQQ